MTVENDFNTLVNVYASVITDMKQSYPAWDTVAQRATKLATCLKSTCSAMQSFVDAIQTVSDLGNNLKGASRDVSACLTRTCMRERAAESRLRAAADSLSEHVVPTLQSRTSYWKARTHELEKLNAKQFKKSKNSKHKLDPLAVTSQRSACTRALNEQRTQFCFFVQTVLPFLRSEVSWIEEASHLIPAVESVENQLAESDPAHLVETVLSDLIDVNEAQACRVLQECREKSEMRASSEDPSPTWSASSDIASGSIDSIDGSMGMTSFGVHSTAPRFYLPAASIYETAHHNQLSRRSSQQSILPKSSVHNPPVAFRAPCDNVKQRPQSFGSELAANGQWPNAYNDSTSTPFSTVPNMLSTDHYNGTNNSSCSSSEAASNALITETLQQIDRIGVDIENLCTGKEAQNMQMSRSSAVQMPRPSLPPPSAYNNAVRMRQASRNGDRPRPPPPERRGSQLSTGTPMSIGRSTVLGSQQSLNSTTTHTMSSFDGGETRLSASYLAHAASKYNI